MADFLLYYKDPCSPDRRIGDIIHTLPDNSTWGNLECIEDFLVVNIPEISFEESKTYTTPLVFTFRDGNTETISKSRYYIDINSSLEYDDLAKVYCEDWLVPKIDKIQIKDKSLE